METVKNLLSLCSEIIEMVCTYMYIPSPLILCHDLIYLFSVKKNVTTNQMNFKLDLGQGQQMVLDQAV